MKRFYILLALLMTGTAAHAGNSISFEIDGHRVRIEAPKNCDSLSCIQVSAPGLSGSGFNLKGLKSNPFTDDKEVVDNSNPPPPAPAPVQAVAPQPAAPVAYAPQPAAAPVTYAAPPIVASTAPVPAANNYAAPAPVAMTPPAPTPVAAAPAPANTPLGIWATEENKGNVRVEQCGQNLCGYAVKTGEKILINMKASDNKWTGQIHDPDSGRNYDSTIAMKGPNALKVQGCAFGGMFCGGQTWNRVS
jgi:uncharacterized protein (DUF2147 family)